MRFIAQSNNFHYIIQWHNNRCTKFGPSLLQNEMYILHCLLTHFLTPRLPTICLLLQGLCMCFRCSEAIYSHAFCSRDSLALLALLLIPSAEIVYLFDHLLFLLSRCVGVHSHSHNALPRADYSTAVRRYLQAHGSLRWGHTSLQTNE